MVAAGIPAKKQNNTPKKKLLLAWIHKSTRSHFFTRKNQQNILPRTISRDLESANSKKASTENAHLFVQSYICRCYCSFVPVLNA